MSMGMGMAMAMAMAVGVNRFGTCSFEARIHKYVKESQKYNILLGFLFNCLVVSACFCPSHSYSHFPTSFSRRDVADERIPSHSSMLPLIDHLPPPNYIPTVDHPKPPPKNTFLHCRRQRRQRHFRTSTKLSPFFFLRFSKFLEAFCVHADWYVLYVLYCTYCTLESSLFFLFHRLKPTRTKNPRAKKTLGEGKKKKKI